MEITTWQIIESSADGFAIGGFDDNPAADVASTLQSTTRDLLTDSVALPGIFSIPICHLNSSYGWTPTLESFFKTMAGPGALFGENGHGQQTPLCYCLGVEDQFGKNFNDQVDVAGWHGGGDPYCDAGYNKPGGPPIGGGPTSLPMLPRPTDALGGKTAVARDEL